MDEAEPLLFGVAALAFVGGGIRAVLIGWVLTRGQASPRNRARVVAITFGAIALLGGATLAWLLS